MPVPVDQITLAGPFDKYLEYAESRLKKPEMSTAKTIIHIVFHLSIGFCRPPLFDGSPGHYKTPQSEDMSATELTAK